MRCVGSDGFDACSHGSQVKISDRLTADAPGTGCDVFDGYPGDLAKALALDGDHSIRDTADEFLLLFKQRGNLPPL